MDSLIDKLLEVFRRLGELVFDEVELGDVKLCHERRRLQLQRRLTTLAWPDALGDAVHEKAATTT